MKGQSFEVSKNERGFYFIEVRHSYHRRGCFILWVHPDFIQRDEKGREFVVFPIEGGRIVRTEKGSYVLRKNPEWITWCLCVSSGYRGSSDIKTEDAEEIVKLKVFHSPLGRIGEDTLCFFNVPKEKKIKVKIRRSGRDIEEDKENEEYEIYGVEIKKAIDEEIEKLLGGSQ
jgi:hypothetical protein